MMSRCGSAIAAFLVALAAAGLTGSLPALASTPTERHFSFDYKATIKVPAGASKLEVWLPYPQSDEHQDIVAAKVEGPVSLAPVTAEQHGNRMVHFTLDKPTAPEVSVTMHFEVVRREYVRRDFPAAASSAPLPAAVKQWLEPDRLVPNSERIRNLAAEVTAGKATPLDKARAIYDYVVSTMKYDKSGTGWGNGDIYWACDAKRGNCTDFHALFIGLCRAVGIPAKFSIGFPLPAARGEGEIGGYHCWAEFYLPGYGWVPVDASEAAKNPDKREYFFGAHDENRVQFSIGRDLTLSPKQAGGPLNFFVYPYVEVDGSPKAEVVKGFRFTDMPAAGAASSGGF